MTNLAYDYSNQALLDAYSKALGRAAVSNSGLVIDVMAGSDKIEAYYLHGVILSRLEGRERPFTRGDRVRVSSKATHGCPSVNGIGTHWRGYAELSKVYEVARVFYEKDGMWTLSFKGEEKCRYPADRFEKVEQERPAAA